MMLFLDHRGSAGSEELDRECKPCEKRHARLAVQMCGLCRAVHDQDYTKSICQEILVPVYMFYHQSGTLGGGLFIEYHRLPKRIQLNGSHEGKTVRGYK